MRRLGILLVIAVLLTGAKAEKPAKSEDLVEAGYSKSFVELAREALFGPTDDPLDEHPYTTQRHWILRVQLNGKTVKLLEVVSGGNEAVYEVQDSWVCYSKWFPKTDWKLKLRCANGRGYFEQEYNSVGFDRDLTFGSAAKQIKIKAISINN